MHSAFLLSERSATARHRRRTRIAAAGAATAIAVLAGATTAQAATTVRGSIITTGASQVVDLADGTFGFSDFGSGGIGLDLSGKGGLAGRGSSSTVLRMNPYSSSRAGLVPTRPGTSNPLFLMRAGGHPILSGFTLQGTAQGHLYNGLKVSGASGAQVTDVHVNAVPGSGFNPPQETVSIDDQNSTGSRYTGVVEDGASLAAVGIASNSSSELAVSGSTFENNRFSAGGAFWQTHDIALTDVVTRNNRTGLNFERCSGTITITRPTILNESNQDLYIGSDRGRAAIRIIDPVFSGSLRIRMPARYRGVANVQQRSDVRVIVHGVDVTSRVVTWI